MNTWYGFSLGRFSYKNATLQGDILVSPLYVELIEEEWNLGIVGSQTQLCHWGVFNDYVLKQLHVSACTGHLQVALGGKLKI